MKNIISVIILLVSFYNLNFAQGLEQDDKQLIISYLDSTGLEFQALKQINYYQIYEAIPALEEKLWAQRTILQIAYLHTLTNLNAPEAESYVLSFIDTAKGVADSLQLILSATYDLIILDNYSTINYVFDWLDDYVNDLTSFREGSKIIEVLPKLLNKSEFENEVKEKLILIAQGSNDPYYRNLCIDALAKKYGTSMIPLLLNRINNDTTSYVRWNAYTKLNGMNYSLMHNLTKDYLIIETGAVYKLRLVDSLLSKYGTPDDYMLVDSLGQVEPNPLLNEYMILFAGYIKPPLLPLTIPIEMQIDSLIDITYQIYYGNWIGKYEFVQNINIILSSAKNFISDGDSTACYNNIKSYQDSLNSLEEDSLNNNVNFITRQGFNILNSNAQYILDRLPEPQQNSNLLVILQNSGGTQIPASNVKYYDTSWKDAVDNGDGTFTVVTTKPNVSVRVFYEGANQTVNNVPAQNNTYTFHTVNAQVELENSSGQLIDEGTVKYYAGAWRDFGTTVNGVASKELLPVNYSFRMTYEYGSNDKQQDISSNPTVVFQTVNAAVQLQNSTGSLIDQGTVQYYAGAWRSFGTTVNGAAHKELLPNNYSFRMTYEYVSKDTQQDLNTNPTVTFSTVLCTVKVKNQQNQPVNNADVKYYSGAWREIGLTNSNGEITKELLPANLSFRAALGTVHQDVQHDLSVNNIVHIILSLQ